MSKKIKVFLYYAGLITGVIVGNYMMNYHIKYADAIMETFGNLDKLNLIHGRELLLYLFLKRLKQILFFSFLFIQISKVITLIFSELYFAMVEGLFLSLCTYYYGISGIIGAFFLILPQLGLFLLVQITGWKLCDNSREYKKVDITKWMIIIIVVTIIFTIVELAVNYFADSRFFIHK